MAASGGTAGLGNGRCARNANKPAEVKKCVQPALSAMGTTPRPASGQTTAANISAAATIAVTRGVAREMGGGPCLTRLQTHLSGEAAGTHSRSRIGKD